MKPAIVWLLAALAAAIAAAAAATADGTSSSEAASDLHSGPLPQADGSGMAHNNMPTNHHHQQQRRQLHRPVSGLALQQPLATQLKAANLQRRFGQWLLLPRSLQQQQQTPAPAPGNNTLPAAPASPAAPPPPPATSGAAAAAPRADAARGDGSGDADIPDGVTRQINQDIMQAMTATAAAGGSGGRSVGTSELVGEELLGRMKPFIQPTVSRSLATPADDTPAAVGVPYPALTDTPNSPSAGGPAVDGGSPSGGVIQPGSSGTSSAVALDTATALAATAVEASRDDRAVPAAAAAAVNGTADGAATGKPRQSTSLQPPPQQQQQQRTNSINVSDSSSLNAARSQLTSRPLPVAPLPTAPAAPMSGAGSSAVSPLSTLLQGITKRWHEMMQVQQPPGPSQNPASGGSAGQPLSGPGGFAGADYSGAQSAALLMAWQETLDALEQEQPQLAAFARLARNNSVLERVVSRTGLPAALLPPSNTALAKYLRGQAQGAAGDELLGDSGSNSSNTSVNWSNATWQDIVADDGVRTSSGTLLLLLRHIVPVRQPQLLDPEGFVTRPLLLPPYSSEGVGPADAAAGGGVLNSVVLQTGLGSYVQVSDLPEDPSATRLQQAVNNTAEEIMDSPAAAVLAQLSAPNQTLLNGSNSSNSSNSSSNSSLAALETKLNRLHIGVEFRAEADPSYLNHSFGSSRVLVIGISGVLDEGDEVINSRTAARLRGAFGWSPEDEQALLSRVYLDPESTYWAQTLRVIGSAAAAANRTAAAAAADSSDGDGSNSSDSSSGSGDNSNSDSSSSSSSSGGGSSGNSSSSGDSSSSPGRRLTQSDDGSSSSSSNSSSNSSNSSSSSSSNATNSTSSSSSGGNASTTASSHVTSPAAAVQAIPPTPPPSPTAAAAMPSAATPTPDDPPVLTPADIAELIARQQQQLLHIHMADALAANLMTIEALGAWTTAAVVSPGLIFAGPGGQQQQQQQQQQGLWGAAGGLNGISSSSNSTGCYVDWGAMVGSWAVVNAGRTGSGSNNGSTFSSGSSGGSNGFAEFLMSGSSNSSSKSGSMCPTRWWSAAYEVNATAAAVRPVRAVRPSLIPPRAVGTIQMAGLVGLSPYQVFPALGLKELKTAFEDQEQQQQQQQAGDANSSSGYAAFDNINSQQQQQQQQQQQDVTGGGSSNNSSSSSITTEGSPSSTADTGIGPRSSRATNSSNSSDNSNETSAIVRGLKQVDTTPSPPPPPAPPTSPASPAPAAAPQPPPPTAWASAVQYTPTLPEQQAAVANTVPAATTASPTNSSSAPVPPPTSVAATHGGNGSAPVPAAVPGSAAGVSKGSTAAAAAAAAGGAGDGDGMWVRVPPDQLSYLSVLQLADLLAAGRVTSQQLVEVYSSRLKRYDDLLHPVVTFTDSLAAQQAEAAQQALATNNASSNSTSRSSNSSSSSSNASAPASLLTGIPYGLKDLIAVPGYPTSWGLLALKNRTINTASWAFSALSGGAGGVLLAKTSTGELAWGDVWFDDITTRNPWNTNTGSCGSSAGSAVTVAAGLLPYAIGSETWGSIVCPATTVGVTAYRPTGGAIPAHGMMQVSPSLDKTGVFCRQVLDCAVVADALMPDTSSSVFTNQQQQQRQGQAGKQQLQQRQQRLHQQDAAAAAAFNYTEHQQHQQQPQWAANGALLPATFEQLPAFGSLCIGYLQGTSPNLVSTLKGLNPGCLKGPLPPLGNGQMVKDVLSVILQAEVAVTLEGLWLEGYINQDNHWYPLIQLGQVSPAAAYIKAQRLRAVLLAEAQHYFAAHGIQVLLKPAKSEVGMDGLATLLDMPELLLPVGFTIASEQSVSEGGGVSRSDGGLADQGNPQLGPEQVWLQPDMNSIIGLPGSDAAIIAVGAAFQSVTAHHMVHPTLPAE